MSSVVPDGWSKNTINECCEILDSQRVPVNSEERAKRKGDYPYYGANGVQGYIDDYIFEGDAILLAEDGGNFDQYADRPIAQWVTGKFWVNNHAHILRAKDNATDKWIFYSLVHKNILKNINGGTRAKLNQSDLKEIEILLSPLPEQKKIASILTSVDEVIENTQKQIDKLQDLKKATMNELLTKGIGHTEFKDSELGRIPKSWEVKTIDDVIKFTGGAQPPRSSFIFAPKEGYVRLLQIRDYKSDRFATYIPEKLSRRNCNEDDVLIGRYGPPIFQILRGKAGSYNVALIKSEPRNGSLLKGYMYHFLTRSDLFHLIDSLSQRTSGQTGIDLDALKSFGFPFPPIEEQHRILEILDHMDAANKCLLNKLTQTHSLKKSLMQDLLTGKVRVTVN